MDNIVPVLPIPITQPLPGQLRGSDSEATRNGLKRLPNGVGKTFDACRAFIDAQLENDSGPRRSSGRR